MKEYTGFKIAMNQSKLRCTAESSLKDKILTLFPFTNPKNSYPSRIPQPCQPAGLLIRHHHQKNETPKTLPLFHQPSHTTVIRSTPRRDLLCTRVVVVVIIPSI